MTFIRNAVGYGLAGLWAMSIWDALAASVLGLWGGWLAALIIIGTMWLLNHHFGLIRQARQAAFIDMAFGIALTGVARDVFLRQDLNALWRSLPTLAVVTLGGALGGYLAFQLERALKEDA
jgi:hypothetical protein